MSSKEELEVLKASGEIVEIKNVFGEKLRGPIVNIEEDRVIYEGLKIPDDEKGYQKDGQGHAIVAERRDLISNIRITKIKDKKVRELIGNAIDVIKKNKEN